MELKNNTILITGGTSGIGLEFASQLLNLGNTIIITGRNQAKLDETKKRFPKVHTFQSDVSDLQAIAQLYEQVVKQFPDLNFLINNAGEMRKINLLDKSTELENITREIEINLSGPIRMVQQFLPHLKTKKTAVILNVTSGLALVPFPVSPIYGATKSGLRSYTKSLRAQLKKTNIKVFELVAPAANTPLNDKFIGAIDSKSWMEADKLVAIAIKGIQNDKLEIYPGLANVIKIMSRLAPGLIFNQMANISEKAFAGNK
ncbi:MAG: SDR family NAD(P)-dependent oxidoreductase [Bacteroidota bacterium]|nr:SDR family NAD(P)-dependent oxidoreductase [Bacteroidota bacterium]